MKKHIISLLVSNQPGVLIRIALVFARRSFNIDSLVTHPTHDKKYSLMTITARGEDIVLAQIIKQLNRLVDVIRVTDTSNIASVQVELALIKVRFSEEKRSEVLHLARSVECSIVDITKNSIIISCVGDEEKLDALEALMESYGIIEIIRTGILLMARGETLTA